MVNLLSLFSTDRRLLETRGSLIIRQLCVNLNPDRIYRSLAEILERDEVPPVGNGTDDRIWSSRRLWCRIYIII
jgi:Vacuolar protein 14 C-terminal Fig4p binding